MKMEFIAEYRLRRVLRHRFRIDWMMEYLSERILSKLITQPRAAALAK